LNVTFLCSLSISSSGRSSMRNPSFPRWLPKTWGGNLNAEALTRGVGEGETEDLRPGLRLWPWFLLELADLSHTFVEPDDVLPGDDSDVGLDLVECSTSRLLASSSNFSVVTRRGSAPLWNFGDRRHLRLEGWSHLVGDRRLSQLFEDESVIAFRNPPPKIRERTSQVY
jgi:hypothetical protein